MRIMAHNEYEFGICGNSMAYTDLEDLADQARRLGAAKMIVPLDQYITMPPKKSQLDALGRIGVRIIAGEIRFPDEVDASGFSNTGKWELRRQKLVQCCQVALAMGS